MSERSLPAGFEDFQPFIDWALPTQSARSAKKMASRFEELVALYELGMRDGRLGAALGHCDQFPLAELPDDARRLFQITLSMAEVRPQVELYGEVSPAHLAPPSHFPMSPASDAS